MSTAQDNVPTKDSELNKIDEIFSVVPPQKVSADLLHALSARIFSESMSTIIKLSEDAKNSNADSYPQVQLVKYRYTHFTSRCEQRRV